MVVNLNRAPSVPSERRNYLPPGPLVAIPSSEFGLRSWTFFRPPDFGLRTSPRPAYLNQSIKASTSVETP
jgi:hypothetical protein